MNNKNFRMKTNRYTSKSNGGFNWDNGCIAFDGIEQYKRESKEKDSDQRKRGSVNAK